MTIVTTLNQDCEQLFDVVEKSPEILLVHANMPGVRMWPLLYFHWSD